MIFKTLENHTNENKTPIIVSKGMKVKIGERSDSNGNWPNWVYCYGLEGQGEGWTPIQIIQIENDIGIILENYSAIELDVTQGETIEGDVELNGWIWCKKSNSLDEGWLPKEKLDPLK